MLRGTIERVSANDFNSLLQTQNKSFTKFNKYWTCRKASLTPKELSHSKPKDTKRVHEASVNR